METNNASNQFEPWDVEVAKRIACAVTSYQAGVPYESLWEQTKNQEESIGTFWLSIAKRIREEMPKKSK
ncbi:MAG TPA: hypothetical protein VFQ23_13125 [Anaerolineales bacterium]|nr:hypothetical protein [Anaerolineales bacterium]